MLATLSRYIAISICGSAVIGVIAFTPLETARAAEFGLPSLWQSIVQQFNTMHAQLTRFGWWSAGAPELTVPTDSSLLRAQIPASAGSATSSDPVWQAATTTGLTVELTLNVTLAAAVTPCGPISFGTIVWGDGGREAVYGLGCAAKRQTLTTSHTYNAAGTYTVTFTDQQGGTSTTSVTVSPLATSTAPYERDDIVSVEAEPMADQSALDEAHTTLTITLRDGTVREVLVSHAAPRAQAKLALHASGFSGNFDSFWQEVLADTVHSVRPAPVLAVEAAGRMATATISGVTSAACKRGACVEGPIVFGIVAWGDGSTDRVNLLSGKSATVTHAYAERGSYTVTFTVAETNETLTREIIIN